MFRLALAEQREMFTLWFKEIPIRRNILRYLPYLTGMNFSPLPT